MIVERITADRTWQLRQLAAEYRTQRAKRDAECPALTAALRGRCRYCLGAWRGPWAASTPIERLEGHATCIVPHAFQQQAVAFLDEHSKHGASYREVANALGVGQGVVRAWWSAVKGN